MQGRGLECAFELALNYLLWAVVCKYGTMEEPAVCDLVRKGLICAEGGAYKNLWKGQVVPSDNPSSGSHTLRQFKVQCNDL
jgi:hypothetical protein